MIKSAGVLSPTRYLQHPLSLTQYAADFVTNTHHENNVAFHEVGRGDRGKRRVPDNPARWWYHSQKRRENGFGLLELIELDESVEESHGNENAAEIRVLEAVL